jgi:hypothetical protein
MIRTVLLCAIALLLLPGTTFAQKPKTTAPKGITVEQILEKNIAAMGGREALKKVNTVVLKGQLTVKGSARAVPGVIENYFQAPNKFYTFQEIKVPVGSQTQSLTTTVVADGKSGWAKEPTGAIRELTTAERDMIADGIDIRSALNWKEKYSKVEYLGIRKVGETETHVIRFMPKFGTEPVTSYYDTKTFLVRRVDRTMETESGLTPVQTYVGDFREVDGMKFPFAVREQIGTVEFLVKWNEIKLNVEIPEEKFAKPK